MNQEDVRVSFYLKKSEADEQGECPIMGRLNVGKYSEAAFSMKMTAPESAWLSGRATGKSARSREINRQLTSFQVEENILVAPRLGNGNFTLIPSRSAVFKLAGQPFYITGGSGHTFATFVHTAWQLDRLSQFG